MLPRQPLRFLLADDPGAGKTIMAGLLINLLGEVFTPAALADRIEEPKAPYGAGPIPPPTPSPHQKLVIFTEHRDTLNDLEGRITMQGRLQERLEDLKLETQSQGFEKA